MIRIFFKISVYVLQAKKLENCTPPSVNSQQCNQIEGRKGWKCKSKKCLFGIEHFIRGRKIDEGTDKYVKIKQEAKKKGFSENSKATKKLIKIAAAEKHIRKGREKEFRNLPPLTLPSKITLDSGKEIGPLPGFPAHKNFQQHIGTFKVKSGGTKYSTSCSTPSSTNSFQPYQTGAIIANLRIVTSQKNSQLQVSLLDDTASRGIKNLFYKSNSLKTAMDKFTSDLTRSHKF